MRVIDSLFSSSLSSSSSSLSSSSYSQSTFDEHPSRFVAFQRYFSGNSTFITQRLWEGALRDSTKCCEGVSVGGGGEGMGVEA